MAVFTALVIFFILTFIFSLGFLAVLSPSETVVVEDNSILHLNLSNKVLAERSAPEDFAFPVDLPLVGNIGEAPTVGLDDLRKAIRSAAESEKIDGIFLEAGGLMSGQALHQELRNELVNFKESGKFIVSFDTYYSEMGYYLSSTADSIYIHPYGDIGFSGFASQGLYLRGMLDKLEVEPEVFVVGEFKSAVEMFMNYERSDEDREQTLDFLNDLHQVTLEAVSESRGLEFNRVKEINDQFLIRRPEDALEFGFIEGILYKNDVEKILKKMVASGEENEEDEEDEDLNLITATNLNKSSEAIQDSKSRDRIAIIYANGEIGSESGVGIIDRNLTKEIERAKENERVKAIVLRVDTPGGSVLASEQIRHALALAAEEKPLVISMGNVSASGGYWISMPADTLVAQSNTITGSIGIFGMLFNAEGLLENKLGINTDVVTTGEFSDLGNTAREMRPNERAIIQEYIEEGYDRFINVVAEGRNMSEEDVRLIAEGRVYSGLRAKELGLVDVIGGLDKSLELAAEMAELDDYRTIAYPEQKTFFETLLEGMNKGMVQRQMKSELGPLYPIYEQYKTMMRYQGVQARMPFDVIVD